ncbi:hypothetical protein PGT21_016187 [Puccinia graminis f. sp. tritici]|uniref:Uncharacterized protein n=1 Tax=Puccinia graminis f. sp. tritici TaxID=56615 RepID=A0A5B0N6F9_PUCGR|nr:hypothetical protein PGT21_016187 [Puccinia graminis f. sp. tritici]
MSSAFTNDRQCRVVLSVEPQAQSSPKTAPKTTTTTPTLTRSASNPVAKGAAHAKLGNPRRITPRDP